MSAKSYFAIIQNDDNKIHAKSSPPTFCGKNLKLFNPILTQTIAIEENDINSDSITDWKVTFFSDSPFSQTLKLKVVKDTLFEERPDLYKSFGIKRYDSVAKVAVIPNTNEQNLESHCKNASWFVRESETLTKDDTTVLPNEWRHVDGRGLALLERYSNLDQPKRQILMLMLAIAYFQAFQEINEQLAAVLAQEDDIQRIENLFSQASKFNARYYFFNPVLLNRYPTYKAWEDIRDAFHLTIKYQEVNEQVEKVYQILSYKKRKEEQVQRHKQQEKTERFNMKLAILGFILSAFGLVEVIDTVMGWL